MDTESGQFLSETAENEKVNKKPITNKSLNWLVIGFLAGLFPVLVLTSSLTTYGAFVFGTPGFLLALVGAFIGKRSILTAWVGAVVGSILWLAFLLFTCAICQ